ncbi:mechanosensitive ion channel protein MscS [Salinisphaera sp. C84B14]|uniref:mechanosensitive ion channel family protein n=1 Tax=Salinisphaera sp. C84B14 TaxID=1304155 RepID=UPI00333EF6AC
MATPEVSSNDQPQTLDIDPGMLVERLDTWLDGAIRLLPNIVVAVIVFLLFMVLASVARRLVVRQGVRRSRENLGEVLGGFLKWTTLVIGFMLSATIVMPTLHPGDLIAGLGVSSIAIGFAFKDILQNWLAGLLILLRQPFNINDQIEINGYEGTVERIETRATIIRTYDGQNVVMPNSDIYTNAVLVKTAHAKRRSQYDIGIGYGDDMDKACELIREALAGVDEIQAEPAPEAFTWDLAASWVTIRARWWTDSRRADVVRVRAQAVRAIKQALDAAHIDMPYETRVALWHDQTEAGEGDRSAQREGWPVDPERPTEPRWKAEARTHADRDRAPQPRADD